jgi:GNAT superfamily N-acetyltransferase
MASILGGGRLVSIRLAGVADAAAIAHVHVRSWLTTYEGIVPAAHLATLNEGERTLLWQDWLRRDISVFVAECAGEVVGFAGGGPIREPRENYDSELYTLYLLKEAQGRGAGKALLGQVARGLMSQGHVSMLVWVLAQNPAAGFYSKMGALPVTRREIEIGGARLPELALGWPDLHVFG